MLPDQQLLTAPLSVCVSASHLKSLLSSEKKKKNRNIKQALMESLRAFRMFYTRMKHSKVHLFRAPVCQCPQVCQHTQISEWGGVLKLSFSHLSHQWAQRQHLICSQLSHWTEGLDSTKNQNAVSATNNVKMLLMFNSAVRVSQGWRLEFLFIVLLTF